MMSGQSLTGGIEASGAPVLVAADIRCPCITESNHVIIVLPLCLVLLNPKKIIASISSCLRTLSAEPGSRHDKTRTAPD